MEFSLTAIPIYIATPKIPSESQTHSKHIASKRCLKWLFTPIRNSIFYITFYIHSTKHLQDDGTVRDTCSSKDCRRICRESTGILKSASSNLTVLRKAVSYTHLDVYKRQVLHIYETDPSHRWMGEEAVWILTLVRLLSYRHGNGGSIARAERPRGSSPWQLLQVVISARNAKLSNKQ